MAVSVNFKSIHVWDRVSDSTIPLSKRQSVLEFITSSVYGKYITNKQNVVKHEEKCSGWSRSGMPSTLTSETISKSEKPYVDGHLKSMNSEECSTVSKIVLYEIICAWAGYQKWRLMSSDCIWLFKWHKCSLCGMKIKVTAFWTVLWQEMTSRYLTIYLTKSNNQCNNDAKHIHWQ